MFKNVSIKRLMVLASVVLLVTLMLLAATSIYLLNGVKNASGGNNQLVHAMLVAKEARFQTVQIQQFLTDASATGEEDPFKEALESRDAAQKALRELARQMPPIAPRLSKIEPQLAKLHDIGVEMARAYISGGREAGNAIMKRKGDGLDDFAEKLAGELDAVVADLQKELDASDATVQGNISHTTAIVLWSSLALIIFAAALMSLLFMRIIPPMRTLRRSMQNVAKGDGDFTVQLLVVGRNEIADVSESFNAFIGRMLEMIKQVARQGGASGMEVAFAGFSRWIGKSDAGTSRLSPSL